MLKLSKTLYGLKQAWRAWYKRLSTLLIKNKFERDKVDTTFFIKHSVDHFLLVQVYVDDIIFDSTNELFCEELSKLMNSEFDINMMGEL